MIVLLSWQLVLALGAPVLLRRRSRPVVPDAGWRVPQPGFLLLALGPAAAFGYALAWTGPVSRGRYPTSEVPWVPGLGLSLSFRLDSLSWLMLAVVGGVGALVLVYCAAYFTRQSTGMSRFGGVFAGFAAAMIALVTTDNLLILYVCWELTTVFSYVLIGHDPDRKASRRAAMQAIIVTTAGGLVMLGGFVVLGAACGTYRVSQVIADPPTGTAATVAAVCILVGAVSKSAQVPLHFWLPSAMAAPTPVSAYLHAAAMVKAGVYLVARFAPALSTTWVWRPTVLTVGLVTMLLGGYRALRQHDLKLIIAFGTVSQLGLLIVLLGAGTPQAALAGLVLLAAHAMFKAALFLGTGIIQRTAGTRDIRKLTHLRTPLRGTAITTALAVASMTGLPFTVGFLGKEAAVTALWDLPGAAWVGPVAAASMLIGSVLTCAYGLRWWWGAFGASLAVGPPGNAQRPSWALTGPVAVLAGAGIVVGLIPHTLERLLDLYTKMYPPGPPGHLGSLKLGAVLATTVALAAGAAAFAWRVRVERFQSRWHIPSAERIYRRSMRRLDRAAAGVTAVTQRGSLPLDVGVIFVALAVGPLAVMVGAIPTGGIFSGAGSRVTVWDRPAQAVAVAIVVAAVILAARARRRLKAVLLVSVAGYATALLFLLHGAPDVALTQILVETITVVVLALVLRRLPPHFSDRPLATSRWVRLAIGVSAGVVMMALAWVAPAARNATPVAVGFPAAATEGGGRNIVAITLVDIRAWDTMGEICVLVAAATGLASLVFVHTRGGRPLRLPDAAAPARSTDAPSGGPPAAPGSTWLPAGQTLSPARRSVIFEVVTRVLFHAMIVFAAYMLFAGHNGLGGGFIAGLLTGIALAVRYLAGGRYELGEAAPVHPGLLLGAGLFLSAGAALASLVIGGVPLQSAHFTVHLPLIGDVHLATSVLFDIGVYGVVVGLSLDILRSLGAEIDNHGTAPNTRPTASPASPAPNPTSPPVREVSP